MNGPKPSPRAPQNNKQPPRHRYWPHYDWCDDWYDDWYDYDYHEWDHDYLSGPKLKNGPMRNTNMVSGTEDWAAYGQGFKDGWIAAMDYMMYGKEIVEPAPQPTPPPAPGENTE